VRWPGKITPGVSDALVSLVDLQATAAAAAGVELSAQEAPDSFNLLPLLSGRDKEEPRDHLVVMSGMGDLAIREGSWKYIPDLAVADGWGAGKKKAGKAARPGLYDLSKDQGETQNLHETKPEVSKRLAARLAKVRSQPATRPQ
jgi:arylsulfatase A-like enzyme